jgi:hypothetical protein
VAAGWTRMPPHCRRSPSWLGRVVASVAERVVSVRSSGRGCTGGARRSVRRSVGGGGSVA